MVLLQILMHHKIKRGSNAPFFQGGINENKNYTYINEVNNDEISKRGSLQVHRVMPTTLEVKDKPDVVDVYNTRTYEIIKDKYKTFNENDKVIETTKLNLKI